MSKKIESARDLEQQIVQKDYVNAAQQIAQLIHSVNLRNRIFKRVHIAFSAFFAVFMTPAIYIPLCRFSLDYVVFPQWFGEEKWIMPLVGFSALAILVPIMAAVIVGRMSRKNSPEDNAVTEVRKLTDDEERLMFLAKQIKSIPAFSRKRYIARSSLFIAVAGFALGLATFGLKSTEEIFGFLFFEIGAFIVSCIANSIISMIIRPLYASVCKNIKTEDAQQLIQDQISELRNLKAEKEKEEEERAKQEHLLQAESEFKKLVSVEPIDMNAMQKLAENGSPSAALYLGEKVGEEYIEAKTNEQTDVTELLNLCKKGLYYLSKAKDAGVSVADTHYAYLEYEQDTLKDLIKAHSSVNESALFNDANQDIRDGQSYTNAGEPRKAITCYLQASKKIEQLMTVDRAYYQKYLYSVYDEIGIIYYQQLSDSSEAYRYFSKALVNCRECASREPNGSASKDMQYISSRLGTAKSTM